MENADPNIIVHANPGQGHGNSPPVQAAPVQGVSPGAATPCQQQMKKIPTMNEVSESLYQALGDLAPRLREFLNANGGEDVVPTLQIIEEVAEQGKERVRQAQQVARRENRPAPITKLPVFGQRSNLPPQKDYRLEYFRGEADLKGKRDPMQWKDWLEAVGRLVTTYALTENAAIEMLQLHARRAAADTISEAIAEGGGYEDIVVQLETRFAGLRPPEQARDMCHQQRMRKDETVEDFSARVRQLATLATRQSSRREEECYEMSRLCFTNGLLPSIQPQVRAQLTIRKHLGEDDPTFSELQQIAHDIKEQQELDDARQDRSKGRVNESVCFVEDEEPQDSEEEDVEQILYTQEDNKFKPVMKRGSWKGKSLGTRSLSQTKTLRKNPSSAMEYVQVVEQCKDEDAIYVYYTAESDRPIKKKINSKDLNVGLECWKCGLKGHFAFGSSGRACPLRDHDIEDTPCSRCRKGGHKADFCIRSYTFDKGN